MVMHTLCGAWHAFHNPFSNKNQSLQENCCHVCRSCKSCVVLARACNLHICLHLQAGAMLCNQCQGPAQCAGHLTSYPHFKKVSSTAVLGTCRLKLLQFHTLRGLYIQVPMHAAQNIPGSKLLQQGSCGTEQLHQDCSAALVENLLGCAAARSMAAQRVKAATADSTRRHELPSQPGGKRRTTTRARRCRTWRGCPSGHSGRPVSGAPPPSRKLCRPHTYLVCRCASLQNA